MDVPGIVADALEDEDVAARVDLGGEDDLFVTPTRTLIYRSEGLLSDESVEEYEHDAERLDVTTGRRKTKLTLTYPIDGSREFRVPANSADAAVSAILAGILNANGVLEPGESVLETFRFSELTLVVTSERLVKHVGEAVWDLEFEEFRYEDVTGLSEEAGSVATQLVLTVDGRAERIKTPNDRAPEVERRLKEALREYHGLGEHEDITAALSPDDDDEPAEAAADENAGGMSFEDGVDPLDAGDTSDTSSIDLGGAEEPAGSGEEGSETGATQDAGETPVANQNAGSAASANQSAGASATSEQTAGGGATSEQAGGESARDAQSATATGTGDDAVATADGAATDDRAAGGSADGSSEPAVTDASATDASATGDEGEEADPFERAGFQSAADSSSDVEAEIEELRTQLEKQNQLLARQQQTIEQLVEELRRSR